MLDLFLADFSHPFPSIAWQTALSRMIVAALMGGVIGFEREAREKPAGLRTHMMICLAACLFTLLGSELLEIEPTYSATIRTDPMRLMEAVTAGVAFLAAGSIITSRGSVQGLITVGKHVDGGRDRRRLRHGRARACLHGDGELLDRAADCRLCRAVAGRFRQCPSKLRRIPPGRMGRDRRALRRRRWRGSAGRNDRRAPPARRPWRCRRAWSRSEEHT